MSIATLNPQSTNSSRIQDRAQALSDSQFLCSGDIYNLRLPVAIHLLRLFLISRPESQTPREVYK